MANIRKIIDSHIHIFPPKRMKRAIQWIKRFIPSLPFDHTLTEDEILSHLEEAGISLFFNYVYPLSPAETRKLNRFNYALSKRVSKAICFGSLHPGNDQKPKIVYEALFDFGLMGLKFHPFVQRFSILDRRMDEVYQIIEKLNRPVVFHTGFDRFYGAQMRPDEMEIILRRHPDLVVVIAHMFYPHIGEAFRLLKKYKNVYLDGANIFSDYREPLNGENIFEGSLVRKGGKRCHHIYFHHSLRDLERYSHRIMFGSDYPVAMNDPFKIYAAVRRLGISSSAKKNILEGTARNFILRFKPDFSA
jgi:predicted TIM-barrel fold metal-dependent hydrolase